MFFVVFIDLERHKSSAYIPTSEIKIMQFTSKINLVSWIDFKVLEKKRFLEGLRDLKVQKNKMVRFVDFNYKKISLGVDLKLIANLIKEIKEKGLLG